jgi:hypothetical protein
VGDQPPAGLLAGWGLATLRVFFVMLFFNMVCLTVALAKTRKSLPASSSALLGLPAGARRRCLLQLRLLQLRVSSSALLALPAGTRRRLLQLRVSLHFDVVEQFASRGKCFFTNEAGL